MGRNKQPRRPDKASEPPALVGAPAINSPAAKATFADRWKSFWAIVGAPSAFLGIVAFAFNFWPNIVVASSPSLDPNQPLQTIFSVTNASKIWLNDVFFTCSFKVLKGAGTIRGFTSPHAPVASLDAGATVPNYCLFNFEEPPNDIDLVYWVGVRYRLPIVGKQITRVYRFVSIHGPDGFQLLREDIGELPDRLF